MLKIIGTILFAIILTEAITELISKSEFFKPIRKFFFKRKESKLCGWIHDLLDCGYCTSVWVACFVYTYVVVVNNMLLNAFFAGIVLHRLSNVLHFIIDRIDRNLI